MRRRRQRYSGEAVEEEEGDGDEGCKDVFSITTITTTISATHPITKATAE